MHHLVGRRLNDGWIMMLTREELTLSQGLMIGGARRKLLSASLITTAVIDHPDRAKPVYGRKCDGGSLKRLLILWRSDFIYFIPIQFLTSYYDGTPRTCESALSQPLGDWTSKSRIGLSSSRFTTAHRFSLKNPMGPLALAASANPVRR
jgi:hypothetical protein